MKKKNVVAIIPARYESSRFPGKSLADLCGKPMLFYVGSQVSKAKLVDKVIIATDSDKIRRAMEQYGFHVVMTSDKHPTGTDRIAEAAEDLQEDIIINVQGDEPLVQPESIDLLVEAFIKDECLNYGQLIKKIEDPKDLIDTTVVKVAVNKESKILYFSRSPIPYPKSPSHYVAYKHIGVYGYRKEFLKAFTKLEPLQLELIEGIEQFRAIEHGYEMTGIVTPYDTVSVDTPGDLDVVRRMMLDRNGSC